MTLYTRHQNSHVQNVNKQKLYKDTVPPAYEECNIILLILMTFRINAINFALTYPQANGLSKHQLFEGLLSLQPVYLLCAVENHANTGIHYHAYFKAPKKLDVRDERYFDVDGNHPNIQGCRDTKAWITYIRKEDKEPLEHGKITTKRGWAEALSMGSEAEFVAEVQNISPRDFVLANERVLSFAKRRYSETPEYIPRFTEFTPTTNMQRWELQRLDKDRPKSLFIKGPSRLGKTAYARSIGRHMYFNGMIDIELWDDKAEYAVFDDVQWEYFPQKKGFIGAQEQFTLTDKYKKKKTVNWGKPIIYLYNPDMDPLLKCTPHEQDWLDQNVIYTEVTKPLFQ